MSEHALNFYAGPIARRHIERHGLQPAHVATIAAAAGGPKGLILGPLDRFIFGQWLPGSSQPVDLVGASIGAWRMATACLRDPAGWLQQLETGYIHGDMKAPPGRLPPPAQISAESARNLRAMFEGRLPDILNHPRYRLHVVTAHGRHLLGREGRWRTPAGYLGATLTNAISRRAMGAWIERVVFSVPDAAGRPTALPFATRDYRTRQVALTPDNFYPALLASGSIPFMMQAVHDIPGAPRGAYWDGGITDYHLHLAYGGAAESAANARADVSRLVLYPHFQQAVVPGWLDKWLKWRHAATPFLDRVLVLAPNPAWVRALPGGKLPNRTDFRRFSHAERVPAGWSSLIRSGCSRYRKKPNKTERAVLLLPPLGEGRDGGQPALPVEAPLAPTLPRNQLPLPACGVGLG